MTSLPCRVEDGSFHVVVEVPRGSTTKLKFSPSLGAFVFERSLMPGQAYPFDWGFVPSTLAPDGDPLDAMVLLDAPSWPGVVVRARPLGVVRVHQASPSGGVTKVVRNDRILAAPARDARIADVSSLSKAMRHGLEQFFLLAAESGGKKAEIEGWEGPRVAEALIDEAARACARARASRPPPR